MADQQVDGDKRLCDNCDRAGFCQQYKAGAACAYGWTPESTEQFDRRTHWWGLATFAVVFTLLAVIAGSLLWALYGPSTPIDIKSLTVAPVQHQGQPIIYTVHACKNFDGPSNLYSQVIGVQGTNTSYSYPERHGVAHVGCHVISVVLPAPTGLPSGTYVLKNEASYQVNPLRTVTVPSQSNVFRLVP